MVSESVNQGAQEGVDEARDCPAMALMRTSTPPEHMNAVEEAADECGIRVTHRERDGTRLLFELARPRTEGLCNVTQKGNWLEGTYLNSTLKSYLFDDRTVPFICCTQEWTLTPVNKDEWVWKMRFPQKAICGTNSRTLRSPSRAFSVRWGCARPAALFLMLRRRSQA